MTYRAILFPWLACILSAGVVPALSGCEPDFTNDPRGAAKCRAICEAIGQDVRVFHEAFVRGGCCHCGQRFPVQPVMVPR